MSSTSSLALSRSCLNLCQAFSCSFKAVCFSSLSLWNTNMMENIKQITKNVFILVNGTKNPQTNSKSWKCLQGEAVLRAVVDSAPHGAEMAGGSGAAAEEERRFDFASSASSSCGVVAWTDSSWAPSDYLWFCWVCREVNTNLQRDEGVLTLPWTLSVCDVTTTNILLGVFVINQHKRTLHCEVKGKWKIIFIIFHFHFYIEIKMKQNEKWHL